MSCGAQGTDGRGKGNPFQDYYDVLHLHPTADAGMVDQAYWHLARVYSDAIATDVSFTEKLDELNEAYAVLRPPELRRQYDQLRDDMLGVRAPITPSAPEPEPPPVPAIETQRPKTRKETRPRRSRLRLPRPRLPRFGVPRLSASGFNVRHLSIPVWQNAVIAVIVLSLASVALSSGAQLVLVVSLLVIGLVFSTVPLLRRMPSFPDMPTMRLPDIHAPRLRGRQTAPSLDPDSLRRSMDAMRARWRAETEGLAMPGTAAAPDESTSKVPQDEAVTTP